MDLKIFNNIFESRLFPTREHLTDYPAEYIKEMIFLYFMALQIMLKENTTRAFAQDYLYRTFKYGEFSTLEHTSTDLFWMLYRLKNDIDKKFPIDNLNFWIKDILKERITENEDSKYLLWLQNQLHVKNSEYKSLRIFIGFWSTESHEQKKLIGTRLLTIFRQYLRKSDIYDNIESLIKEEVTDIKIDSDKEIEHAKHLGGIKEDVSATSSSAIASVVQPMMFSRRVKKSNREKRK